jgi:hypothetical protein
MYISVMALEIVLQPSQVLAPIPRSHHTGGMRLTWHPWALVAVTSGFTRAAHRATAMTVRTWLESALQSILSCFIFFQSEHPRDLARDGGLLTCDDKPCVWDV